MTDTPDESTQSAQDTATDKDSAATDSTPRRGLAALILGGVALLLVGLGLGVGLGTWLGSDNHDDVPATDSAAVGFAQDMIRHHEQGVEMATLAINNGTDSQVKSIAYDILTTQTNEIGQMQSWLTRWGYPIINPGEAMAWMGHSDDDHDHGDMSAMPGMSPTATGGNHDGHEHDSTTSVPNTGSSDEPPMPGMATDAEMSKLRTLKGRESDTYFMQLMLRHHEGGEHMMAYAANPDNVSQDYVRELASAMARTQAKEITTLKAILAEYGAPTLPMN
ncbi:DUF305 domain-containing protein [Gordonia sp. CPCC 205333]|uniref:DUF305 domain-containing protein n=1 Tax=Gordonia sp. CPCC 205333 TaxID=3140790 RepID=UPI003AF3FBBD